MQTTLIKTQLINLMSNLKENGDFGELIYLILISDFKVIYHK